MTLTLCLCIIAGGGAIFGLTQAKGDKTLMALLVATLVVAAALGLEHQIDVLRRMINNPIRTGLGCGLGVVSLIAALRLDNKVVATAMAFAGLLMAALLLGIVNR